MGSADWPEQFLNHQRTQPPGLTALVETGCYMLFTLEGESFRLLEKRGYNEEFVYDFLESQPELWTPALSLGAVAIPAGHSYLSDTRLWVVAEPLERPEFLLVAEIPYLADDAGLLLRYTLLLRKAWRKGAPQAVDLPVWLTRLLPQLESMKSPLLIVSEPGSGQEEMIRAFLRNRYGTDERARFFYPGRLSEAVQLRELFGDPAGVRLGGSDISISPSQTVVIQEASELTAVVQLRLLALFSNGQTKGDWIFKTLKDTRAMAEAGVFLPALYTKLRPNELHVPPLRKCLEDLPHEVERLLMSYQERYRRSVTLHPDGMRALQDHSWPGNWTELKKTLETAFLRCSGNSIRKDDLLLGQVEEDGGGDELNLRERSKELEKSLLLQAYALHAGNQVQMARALGISRGSLQYKMGKYKLNLL